jgi:hypothetical protein
MKGREKELIRFFPKRKKIFGFGDRSKREKEL